jgi:hypothetical protein
LLASALNDATVERTRAQQEPVASAHHADNDDDDGDDESEVSEAGRCVGESLKRCLASSDETCWHVRISLLD